MSTCASCGLPLDERDHAICAVCVDARLCLDCAPRHLCTADCASRGCLPGLCVKRVRDGSVHPTFGIASSR